jgi:hypothetical protein
MADPTPAPPQPEPDAKFKQTPIFISAINELNTSADQLQKRQKLMAQIEEKLTARYGVSNRVISYIFRFGHAKTSMSSSDIPSFETILNSITSAEQINLILHSPGGDGTIVEKMVDMCRSHLSGTHRQFRVIVPNIAKSAATVLALGADKVLMGYCSELGPIDPQVPIAVSGVMQWVSAFAFVDSRDKLMGEIATAVRKGRPTVGLLQQISGLNIPFTNETENQIGFAKKTAATLLDKYMLISKIPQPGKRKTKANDIAKKLLSKQLFPVHGQYIDGVSAQKMGLEVEVLDKNDELWELVWQYYIRAEVQMNIQIAQGRITTKLFESSTPGASLATQDTPN